ALQAAIDGKLRLLKKMAITMDLQQVRGFKGRNLLHYASAAGRLDLCRFLVEELGFDANSTSAEGETAILVATNTVENRTDDIVPVLRYLLDRGGDPEAPNDKGYTPLHNAAEHGHHEAVRVLLSKGVPVDPLNRGASWGSSNLGAPCGRTARTGPRDAPALLHLAAAKDRDQAVKILLEREISEFGSKFTSLSEFNPLITMTCGAGADVNLKGPSGQPVLFNAVDGLTDIVKFSLEAGADPNIHDGDGKFPVMLAAASEQRELVQILLPRTKSIPSMPDWSVDGIIRTMKYLQFEPQGAVAEQIADANSEEKEAFAKGDYIAAVYSYTLAMEVDPLDATLFANRSLCWQRLGDGELALSDAQRCKALRPRWAKAWYREGTALVLLKVYKKAVDVFEEALKLDPTNDNIKKAIR
ncbi:hypothetical protein PVAP13_3KG531380, partial [Panicum virgatum]